jgi:hypothetical protein
MTRKKEPELDSEWLTPRAVLRSFPNSLLCSQPTQQRMENPTNGWSLGAAIRSFPNSLLYSWPTQQRMENPTNGWSLGAAIRSFPNSLLYSWPTQQRMENPTNGWLLRTPIRFFPKFVVVLCSGHLMPLKPVLASPVVLCQQSWPTARGPALDA